MACNCKGPGSNTSFFRSFLSGTKWKYPVNVARAGRLLKASPQTCRSCPASQLSHTRGRVVSWREGLEGSSRKLSPSQPSCRQARTLTSCPSNFGGFCDNSATVATRGISCAREAEHHIVKHINIVSRRMRRMVTVNILHRRERLRVGVRRFGSHAQVLISRVVSIGRRNTQRGPALH